MHDSERLLHQHEREEDQAGRHRRPLRGRWQNARGSRRCFHRDHGHSLRPEHEHSSEWVESRKHGDLHNQHGLSPGGDGYGADLSGSDDLVSVPYRGLTPQGLARPI